MNKKRLVALIVLIAVIGLIGVPTMMHPLHSHPPTPATPPNNPAPLPPDLPQPHPAAQLHTIGPYGPFRTKKLSLPFTFEYPRQWVAGEEERSGPHSYQQVVILGPRNAQDTYTAGLTIRVLPTKQAGGEYDDLQALVQWRRAQYLHAEALKWNQDKPVQLQELRGQELEFQFEVKLPKGSERTTLLTHLVVLAHGERFFEFSYSADAHEYDRYHQTFDHLLQSVRLTQ